MVDAVELFEGVLMELMRVHIPDISIATDHGRFAWVNGRCKAAIAAESGLTGHAHREAVIRSNEILNEEYQKHITRTRAKMLHLPRGSKAWWTLNRRLLNPKAKSSTIAPLKQGNLAFTDHKNKADLLAKVFCDKNKLPPRDHDPHISGPDSELDLVPFVRSRLVRRILTLLDVSSSTGPDGVPSHVLKKCKVELAFPIALIAARIWRSGHWPTRWRLHWVHPLHKKSAVSNPANYRGIHLTSVLSKMVERILYCNTHTNI